MKAESLGRLSLLVSALPLTLFIIRHLKIGMDAPWVYIIFASEYGADAVCGCAYDEDKHLLIAAKIDRADSRNSRMMAYQKQ